MNLSEYLLYRDIKDLHQIAHVYRCECNKNSKLELVQAIHHKILNRTFFSEYVQNLDRAFILFATYILFQPTRRFSTEELLAKGQYIQSLLSSPTEPRKWVRQLISSGWLFPVSSNAQILLEIPEEVLVFLQREWIGYWQGQISGQYEIQDSWVRRNEGTALARDVHLFLQKLNASSLPLTVEGVIHKKVLESILLLLSVQESVITAEDDKRWRFGYGRRFPVYPNRFAFIYDYCFMKGWIQEEKEQVYLTEQGKNTLLNFSPEIILEDMRKYWLKLYKKPINSLPFVINLIQELTLKRWVLDSDLFLILKNWLKSYYYDDETKLFEQRIIQMMIHLGMLQAVVDPETNQRFIKRC